MGGERGKRLVRRGFSRLADVAVVEREDDDRQRTRSSLVWAMVGSVGPALGVVEVVEAM